MITTGMHEANLVVLSILIAVFASFTALSLAGRQVAFGTGVSDALSKPATVRLRPPA